MKLESLALHHGYEGEATADPLIIDYQGKAPYHPAMLLSLLFMAMPPACFSVVNWKRPAKTQWQ